MCELYKVDPCILKELDNKLKRTYNIFSNNEANNKNYNNLILKTTNWNKEEREKFYLFQKEVSPLTTDGKKNNKYYRTIFEYQCIVDSLSFNKIIDRLNYCSKNSADKEFKMLKANIDKVFFIISLLIQNSIDHTKENKFNKNNQIVLAKKFLEYFIQRESSDLIAYMIHIGLIDGDLDTNNSGTYTGKCRKFWLTYEPSKEFVVYPITNRDMINKRFSEEKEMVFEEKKKKSSFERNIKEKSRGVIENKEAFDYFTQNISMDIDGAFDYLSNNLNINPINFSNFVIKIRKESPFKLTKIGRDSFGNRLYHPLCNFPKQLRQFIKINDNPNTDTLDICNSQPYFFTQLFNLSFLKYIKTHTNIITNDEYKIIYEYATDKAYKPVIKTLSKIVSNGIYYDYISSELNISRGEAKTQNMYLFFSEGFNKISSTLKHEFKLLIEVKNKISFLNKKRFAEILQKIESHIIIDKIFFPLKDMGINTIPIHDAFIAKKSDMKDIEIFINNLSVQMKIDKIPFTKMNNKENPLKKDKIVSLFRDKFKVHRERFEREEYNRNITNNFMFEKMNYMLLLMGEKRAKFGFHRKDEKQEVLLNKVINYKFSEEQEIAFGKFEKSLLHVENVAMKNYDFFLKNGKTFKNYSQHNGIRYVREEKITPLEFLNDTFGTEFKNRVNFNKYNYNKNIE